LCCAFDAVTATGSGDDDETVEKREECLATQGLLG